LIGRLLGVNACPCTSRRLGHLVDDHESLARAYGVTLGRGLRRQLHVPALLAWSERARSHRKSGAGEVVRRPVFEVVGSTRGRCLGSIFSVLLIITLRTGFCGSILEAAATAHGSKRSRGLGDRVLSRGVRFIVVSRSSCQFEAVAGDVGEPLSMTVGHG